MDSLVYKMLDEYLGLEIYCKAYFNLDYAPKDNACLYRIYSKKTKRMIFEFYEIVEFRIAGEELGRELINLVSGLFGVDLYMGEKYLFNWFCDRFDVDCSYESLKGLYEMYKVDN